MSRKALVPINILATDFEPVGKYAGDQYFNTTSKIIYTFDGTAWNPPAGGGSLTAVDGGNPSSSADTFLDGGNP